VLNPLNIVLYAAALIFYALFWLNQASIVLQTKIFAFLHYQGALVLDVQFIMTPPAVQTAKKDRALSGWDIRYLVPFWPEPEPEPDIRYIPTIDTTLAIVYTAVQQLWCIGTSYQQSCLKDRLELFTTNRIATVYCIGLKRHNQLAILERHAV